MEEKMIIREKAILIAVAMQNQEEEVESSVAELAELADTAGADTIAKFIQNRERPHPGTYFGKGKIEELALMVRQYDVDMVICDDELSPSQLKNLTEACGCKVIDRPILIMDIFAKHAHTKEGILQVEMAQMRYRLSRLAGLGAGMSRLGGGIGTRGPGEKKLESDRRHIRRRIGLLKEELDQVHRSREILREGRAKQNKPIISIVGYTNAGKSTLLNYLTDAGVLSENKLFATLDPTTRNLTLKSGKEVLLVDTVGFIRKLPHHIVEAFKSTLEEVVYADLLVHVVDGTNEDALAHMDVVHNTLRELGAADKPVLTLINKTDLPGVDGSLNDPLAFKNMNVSAITGQGLEEFLDVLEEKLMDDMHHLYLCVPYDKGQVLQKLRSYGQIIKEDHGNEGVEIEIYIEEAYVNKYELLSMEVKS